MSFKQSNLLVSQYIFDNFLERTIKPKSDYARKDNKAKIRLRIRTPEHNQNKVDYLIIAEMPRLSFLGMNFPSGGNWLFFSSDLSTENMTQISKFVG